MVCSSARCFIRLIRLRSTGPSPGATELQASVAICLWAIMILCRILTLRGASCSGGIRMVCSVAIQFPAQSLCFRHVRAVALSAGPSGGRNELQIWVVWRSKRVLESDPAHSGGSGVQYRQTSEFQRYAPLGASCRRNVSVLILIMRPLLFNTGNWGRYKNIDCLATTNLS